MVPSSFFTIDPGLFVSLVEMDSVSVLDSSSFEVSDMSSSRSIFASSVFLFSCVNGITADHSLDLHLSTHDSRLDVVHSPIRSKSVYSTSAACAPRLSLCVCSASPVESNFPVVSS